MKKSIFLFFAAILCAMTANAAYYFHGSKTGNDWPGKEMTKSADGYYYYYEVTSGTHEFKITSKQDWSGTEYTTVLSKYNGTDVAVTGGNGSNCKITNCTSTHYVIIYPKSTLINNTTNYYVCASKTLPNGFGAIHFKHPWNGGSWTYQTATNNGDGTFSYVGKYGNAGVNWCVQKNGTGEKYIGSPTLVGSPATGDDCTFTFNGADQTITITKKVNKNLGDITITMNCNQQPKIFFWDVEGKTCAEWPGEDMVAAGANTYTYTFEDVDVDLGVNYKINLKEVNENEWNTGDLHTTTDVTHDASNLNIPTIGMHGNFIDGWKDTEKFTISDDYTSATLTLEGITEGDHEFGMQINGSWTSNGKTFTRNANSAEVKSGSGNLKLTADYTGNYIFTYTYKTQTLEVTYPELPTPEYKDITIQVYAKQVPNIWWWNGGDNCPSTEDIVNPSTGNKYQWNEAPAMEKVAGEDNWYTKTFAQVDITKGGIKFKLQSTDHSTSTTNEVVTTEDKCYDARVIATVTETTCGELPSGEVPTVTYNVTVPAETPACYIAGAMNGWSHQAMTRVDETHYTITIEGAQKTQEYKYSASNNWDCVELNEDGSEKSNRTWTENDVVAKWATPPTYTIVGATAITGANWDLANEANKMIKEGEAYTLTKTGLKLETGDYEYKVAKNGAWGDGQYPAEGNQKVTITETAEYTIVYTYNVGTSLTAVATKTGEYTPVQTVYTVAGDAALCGTNWQADDATNDMTANGDGTYTWTKADVKLTSNVGFKVVKNHDFGNGEYPAENWNINLANYEGAAVYTVTITFTESSKDIAVTLTKTGEATPPVITYVLMGVNGDWDNGIALTQNPGNEDEYVLENQVIIKATDAVKVVTLTDGTATAWCGNVDAYSNATYTGGGDDNILLEDGIYTFYFKKTANNIYINQTGYVRNVTNQYGTICLPYASASTTGATFYRVAGKETGKVYLESVDALEAGVPYIYEKTANQIKVVYTGEKTPTAASANGLVGTFTDNTEVATGNYILYNNAFCQAEATCYVNANRAYLVMEDIVGGQPTQMPGRRYIGMSVQGENEATGFENITAPAGKTIKAIVNGQLIIIRDGEMYNAQGVRF